MLAEREAAALRGQSTVTSVPCEPVQRTSVGGGTLGTWNPAKSVEKDSLKPKRVRLSNEVLPDWYARVHTMRNPIQRDGLVFALFTGLRSEDVRTTRFEHADAFRTIGCATIGPPRATAARDTSINSC